MGAFGLKVALMHPKQGRIPSRLPKLVKSLQKPSPGRVGLPRGDLQSIPNLGNWTSLLAAQMLRGPLKGWNIKAAS